MAVGSMPKPLGSVVVTRVDPMRHGESVHQFAGMIVEIITEDDRRTVTARDVNGVTMCIQIPVMAS